MFHILTHLAFEVNGLMDCNSALDAEEVHEAAADGRLLALLSESFPGAIGAESIPAKDRDVLEATFRDIASAWRSDGRAMAEHNGLCVVMAIILTALQWDRSQGGLGEA